MPYRSFLWYLLLALLCWGAFDVWKRCSGWKPTLLTWLRHGLRGHLHPTQARFFTTDIFGQLALLLELDLYPA